MFLLINICFWTACLGLGIQSILWIILDLALASKTLSNESKKASLPISIIVVGRNEAQNIPALLKHILTQQYPEWECIYVDDRSTDESRILLKQYTAQSPQLKVIEVDAIEHGFNPKKYCITQAIASARHEHLLFIDADCEPSSPLWITEMSAPYLQDKEIVIGFSPYKKERGFLNSFIQYETTLTGILYLSAARLGFPYMSVGRNVGYTKSFFYRNEGFGNFKSTTGGDDDLIINHHSQFEEIGTVFTPNARTISQAPKSLKQWFFQKIRHLSIGKKYTFTSKFLLGIYYASHIGSWMFIPLFMAESMSLNTVTILFIWKTALLLLIFSRVSKKLGYTHRIVDLILLDMLFAIYFITIGKIALFAKRIRWK